jgi:hypothetical protein
MGPFSEAGARNREVCFAPVNGHRQLVLSGPKSACHEQIASAGAFRAINTTGAPSDNAFANNVDETPKNSMKIGAARSTKIGTISFAVAL